MKLISHTNTCLHTHTITHTHAHHHTHTHTQTSKCAMIRFWDESLNFPYQDLEDLKTTWLQCLKFKKPRRETIKNFRTLNNAGKSLKLIPYSSPRRTQTYNLQRKGILSAEISLRLKMNEMKRKRKRKKEWNLLTLQSLRTPKCYDTNIFNGTSKATGCAVYM